MAVVRCNQSCEPTNHHRRPLTPSSSSSSSSALNFVVGPAVGVPDTGWVSVGALVQYVGEVLGRAHSLFGDPPDSGGPAAVSAGNTLGGARDVVRTAGRRVDAMSGAFPASYGNFAGRAGPALDGLAGRDDGLGGALTDAAAAARSGRGHSSAVVNGAAADTTALSASPTRSFLRLSAINAYRPACQSRPPRPHG